MGRFSDEELTDMRQKFDEHVARFNAHIEAENSRWESVLCLQEKNAQQIERLELATERLAKSTEGMVEAWQVATSGIRFFVILGKVAKWLGSLTVFIALAHWLGWPWGNGK